MKYASYYNYRALFGYRAFIRDISIFSRNTFLRIFFGRLSKIILFYPQFPDRNSDIFKALVWSRFRLTSNPKVKFDYIVNWEDTTYRKVDQTLSDLSREHYVLNLDCKDISKEKVERVFEKVFGYSTFIDPLSFQGMIIEKSDLNSKHKLVKKLLAPIKEIKKGCVYQRFFINPVSEYRVDYRVPVIDGQIPMVSIKYKLPDDITDTVIKYKILEPLIIFNEQEIKKIMEFCQEMKLEYGELDIIRDKQDGKIYIIDANTTAYRSRAKCSNQDWDLKNKTIRKLFIHQLSVNEERVVVEKENKFGDTKTEISVTA